MPLFHWEWEQQSKWIQEKARDDAYREVVRQNMHPQAGEIVSHLVTDYPWLPPGVVASMATNGVDPSSPLVTAVARLAYQQKAATGDWSKPGDRVVPKFPPRPPAPTFDPNAQPLYPPPAPPDGSQQQTDALLNPTPQPTSPSSSSQPSPEVTPPPPTSAPPTPEPNAQA